MSEPIPISFTYSRNEYIRAVRCYYKAVLRVRLDVSIAAIVFGIGCYLVYSQGIDAISLMLMILGASLLLIIGCAWFIVPRLKYACRPKLKQPYELVFSDASILFRTTGIESRLDWSFYRKWLANDEFYLLFYGKMRKSVIPRRVFLNDSADRAFRELLIRKIGDSPLFRPSASVPQHQILDT